MPNTAFILRLADVEARCAVNRRTLQLRLYLNNPPLRLHLITHPRHSRSLNCSQKLYLPSADICYAAAGQRLADGGASGRGRGGSGEKEWVSNKDSTACAGGNGG